MADSEWGVACQRKINKVGRKTFGCLIACHNSRIPLLVASFKVEDKGPRERCSFTSTATADVNKGSSAERPKTNLQNAVTCLSGILHRCFD